MRARCQTLDWSKTNLGAVNTWPQSLRTAAQMVLASPFPNIILWGTELIQLYNDGYRELMGNKHPAGLGQPTQQCWPEVWHINQPIYERVWAGASFSFDDALYPITRSGTLQDAWFTLAYSPILDESGRVGGILVTVIETTHRLQKEHQREQALLNSEEKYRTLFESIDEGFCIIELRFDQTGLALDYRFLDVNPTFEQQTGLHNALGQWVRQLAPTLEQHWFDIYGQVAQTGQDHRFEAEAAALGRWYDVYAFRVGKPGDNNVGVLFNDITRRKQVEETLRQSEERYRLLSQDLEKQVARRTDELGQVVEDLKRSNENLQTFAYMASHDLQEPLRKVQQFGNLLQAQYGQQLGEGLDYLVRMQSATVRMSTLIKDLLSYSSIAVGRDRGSPLALDVVVQQALSSLEILLEETNAQVKVEALPQVVGDATQLGQLFQNLLANAVKFSRVDRQGVARVPQILIRAKRVPASALTGSKMPVQLATTYHQIDVADNGIGFEEKDRERIFLVFQRLHGRHEFSGTGIGLAICRKVVENHGGLITASSQPGQGATFTVYLPA